MKKYQTTFILLSIVFNTLFAINVFAQNNGYYLKAKFTNCNYAKVYLAHYYGKSLPTIYTTDSAQINKYGVATFQREETILGGIYLLLLSDKKTYTELLLNNGDKMEIEADINNLPEGLAYKNSSENERFQAYIKILKNNKEPKELYKYRRKYCVDYPNTLLSTIFYAIEVPQVPEGKHYLPNGKEDEFFAYHHYKTHYWDRFDFKDDRLIHTPIYDAKLDEYMNKLVLPIYDSLKYESDYLLKTTLSSPELFKYTLWWLTNTSEKSNTEEMGKLYKHLIQNYYNKGYAKWVTEDGLKKYNDKLAKNEKKSNSLLNQFLKSGGLEGVIDAETLKSAVAMAGLLAVNAIEKSNEYQAQQDDLNQGNYELVLSEGAHANVRISSNLPGKYLASIDVDDGGIFSSNVDENLYTTTITNKHGTIIKTYTNPFDDNGIGNPQLQDYDLPGEVKVSYRTSYSDEWKVVVMKVYKPGFYTLNIR